MPSKNTISRYLFSALTLCTAIYAWFVPETIRHTTYLISCGMVWATILQIYTELLFALCSSRSTYVPCHSTRKAYAIIAALLPNEQNIVFDILAHYDLIEYSNLTVILAYNSPYDMELMGRLNTYTMKHHTFIPIRIMNSHSKAENLNHVLANYIHEHDAIIGLFDCDHKPCINAFDKAAYRLYTRGYDFVQGKCRVRNNKENALTKFLMFDFEIIYSIFHRSRVATWGYAIFGGSNGYWRSDVIKKYMFDGSMLTEDIDLTVRALLDGRIGYYDDTIVSTELAPLTIASLMSQRLRWAQGWAQVSIKYLIPTIASKHISLRTRIGLLCTFSMRELFPYFNLLVTPLTMVYLYRGGMVSIFGICTSCITLLAYPSMYVGLWRTSPDSFRDNHKTMVRMLFMGLAYSLFTTRISIIAHMRNLISFDLWEVTRR
uniref:Glycosyltransferase 2-like domain-containing protein n=1 Tax=viral metagenome TaxID=1070528 RepID=A0A6C0LZ43_9ZZZZ